MSFDWMQSPTRPAPPGAFRDQFVREIRERARLLSNLGFQEADAVGRIQAALAWEFDTSIGSTPKPGFYDEVPGLVAAAYAHARRGATSPAAAAAAKTKKTK